LADGKDEIDIVALDGKDSFIFCKCKWSAKKVSVNALNELQRKADKFPRVTRRYFGFFSKSGFAKELENLTRKRDDILLFPFAD